MASISARLASTGRKPPDDDLQSGGALRPPLAVIHIAILLPLCWILFFHNLDQRDLWSSHEARAAMDAQTMLDDGQWGMPHLYDGRPELQKPPLYYWLVALIAQARGGQVDAWAVRLPASLSAVACVLCLYAFGWLRGRPIVGFVAAGVMASAIHFTWLARIGRIDMPFTLAVSIAVGCAYRAFEMSRHRLLFLIAANLAVAFAVMLKGPIGLVLLGAVLGVFLLSNGKRPSIWRLGDWPELTSRLGLWWGLPVVSFLTAPWFLWANSHTGGQFFQEFFWHHNFERALGSSPLFEHHGSHPWWFYGAQFVADFLPWSPLFLVALYSFWRQKLWSEDADARLGLVWLLAIGGVLSFSSFKRADYLLPAYPGAALFIACMAEGWYRDAKRIGSRVKPLHYAAACGFMLMSCAVGWIVKVDCDLPRQELGLDCRPFALVIRRYAPRPHSVLFFRTESHDLAFHVGRPLEVFVEWERLEAWSTRPETSYIVMPVKWFTNCPPGFPVDRLEVILYQEDLNGIARHEPLVLLKTRPPHESLHARNSATASDRLPAD
ncbi:MAG: ArnT family glycosyltransferase [Gemmataceae bacterium]